MTVLVVGSIALDSVRTPHGECTEMLGGSATYFSLAAAHLSPVNVVAVLGDDFPDEYRKSLASRNINLDGLQTARGRTFRWAGTYSGSKNEASTLKTDLNVFEGFDPMLPDHYRTTPWVFLGNIDPGLQRKVMSQMQGHRMIALDTMNFWITGHRASLMETLKSVDLAIINEAELKMLTGEHGIPKAAAAMTRLGPRTIVIKRGEYGCLLFHEAAWFCVPAYPEPNVVDPTGAGDSFAGGFMGALAQSGSADFSSLKRAAVMGSVMASYNITSFGPWRLAELLPADIERRFTDFRNLVAL